MKIKILGSAAGGGFPQWNCNCPNCDGLRKQNIQASARTQSSLAISGNGTDWLLVNASPDILFQIRSTPELQPARHKRDTGISGVLLTDSQIDHVTGLLMLREHNEPLKLFTTESVWEDLSTGFPITKILAHYCGVAHYQIPTNRQTLDTSLIPGFDSIEIIPLPLLSKAPPYSPKRNAPTKGDNIGLQIVDRESGNKVFYAPGLGEVESHIKEAMEDSDLILVDGTLWSDDEMQKLELSDKTSRSMGHLPISGKGNMLDILGNLRPDSGKTPRKVFVHINNTNPILREDSAERAELAKHGIEVANDGMTFQF